MTGVPIEDTVNKLLAISARPRDLMVSRVAALKQQQVAVTSLTASVIAIQLAARNLGQSAVFHESAVTSSNSAVLSAAKNGTPAVGSHTFVPVQQAQSHQLLSGGFAATDQPLGAGTISFKFGGFLDEALELGALNGGAGVQRGKIRITDRSGASEVIDLSRARTIDDVLNAINSAENIRVSAGVSGDSIQLTDLTGQTTSNLKVQDVGSGSTAADLGLAAIDVADSTALGQDIVRLNTAVPLSQLNHGNGLTFREGVDELEVLFRNGSAPLRINFDFAASEATLGDLLDALNAADPNRLQARIHADGDRLELIDLTSGGGQFAVSSVGDGTLAEELGLAAATSSGSIAGQRLLGGLKTTLLSALHGGRGFGTLGQIQLTDRTGATATVDLSDAETVDDVLAAINSAGLGIEASLNQARHGIQLRDTTGASAANFQVTDADGTGTATALGIAVDDAVTSVDSGSLDRQIVSRQTLLSDWKQGSGVSNGSFTITDTLGVTKAVNLTVLQPKTIGDVLDAINGLGLALEARINDAGDGIALVDTGGGSTAITVTDSGGGRAASQLGIAGQSTAVEIGGVMTQVLSGSTALKIELDDDDTLTDLVNRINESGFKISASIFSDGSGMTPHRLSITSGVSGRRGQLLIDSGELNLPFQEVVAAQDALLLIGSGATGGGILASSPTNTFHSVVDGLTLTIQGTSTEPVEIRVSSSDKLLETNAKLFVEKYNATIKQLKELTAFDPNTNTTGTLFGSSEALRVEMALSGLVSGAIIGAGSIRSLEELGFGLRDDGEIDLDMTKLKEVFAERPEDVETFFTKAELGFAARMDKTIERLAGVNNSVLLNRNDVLQGKIESANERIETLNARLDRERTRLLRQFYQLELTIARLQDSLTAINNIQAIPPLQ